MSLQWKSNERQQVIAFENDISLCSSKDPQKEAEQWLLKHDLTQTEHVLVLGLGAGHHIQQLLNVKKFKTITVIETRPQLIEAFEEYFPLESERVSFFHIKNHLIEEKLFQFLSDKQPTVLSFRPAWGSSSSIFEDLFSKMTFRNLQMIQKYLKENDLGQEVNIDKLDEEKNLIHLKNIYENLKEVSSPFGVTVKLVRELWI